MTARRRFTSAIAGAAGDDVVLVAGKGHEDYQIVGAERRALQRRRSGAVPRCARGARA